MDYGSHLLVEEHGEASDIPDDNILDKSFEKKGNSFCNFIEFLVFYLLHCRLA